MGKEGVTARVLLSLGLICENKARKQTIWNFQNFLKNTKIIQYYIKKFTSLYTLSINAAYHRVDDLQRDQLRDQRSVTNIIIIQEIVHEVHIIYIYSKTIHMNIKRY